MGRRQRFVRRFVPLLVLALTAAYTVFVSLSHPSIEVQIASDFPEVVSGPELSLDGYEIPLAVGVNTNDGTVVSNNAGKTEPIIIASLAKLAAILVSLDSKPMDTESSETYTLSKKDMGFVSQVAAQNGVTVRVVEGQTLTRYQLMQLMILASANNYALSYVDWIFGSNDEFVKTADAFFQKNGLNSVKLAEPTGLSSDNTATAEDLTKLGLLVLKNPIISEIMAQESATIPGIAKIRNGNPLFDYPGVRGMKIGATDAGYNLMLARDVSAGEGEDQRAVTFAVTTLGLPSYERLVAVNEQLSESLDSQIQVVQIVPADAEVGKLVTWDDRQVSLLTAQALTSVLAMGESANVSVEIRQINPGDKAGSVVGSVNLDSPSGQKTVDVVLAESVPSAGFWWRFFRPFALLG